MNDNFMHVLAIIFILILVGFMFGTVLIYKSTRQKKGKWGFNINPPQDWLGKGLSKDVICSVCGETVKGNRKPQDLYEILWGGCTCPGCNSKLDKWGKIRDD